MSGFRQVLWPPGCGRSKSTLKLDQLIETPPGVHRPFHVKGTARALQDGDDGRICDALNGIDAGSRRGICSKASEGSAYGSRLCLISGETFTHISLVNNQL